MRNIPILLRSLSSKDIAFLDFLFNLYSSWNLSSCRWSLSTRGCWRQWPWMRWRRSSIRPRTRMSIWRWSRSSRSWATRLRSVKICNFWKLVYDALENARQMAMKYHWTWKLQELFFAIPLRYSLWPVALCCLVIPKGWSRFVPKFARKASTTLVEITPFFVV